MNFYPCNESADVIIDGVSHKGKLKLRNEYIPIVDTFRFTPPYNNDSSTAYDEFYGCGSVDGNVVVFLHDMSIYDQRGGVYVVSSGQAYKYKNNIAYTTYYSLCLSQKKSIAFIANELYGVYDGKIYKFDKTGTQTEISTLPQKVTSDYKYEAGGFINENGERCIYLRGHGSNHVAYVYNIDTDAYTDMKTSNIETTTSEYVIFESNKPNTLYMWSKSNSQRSTYALYKCNVKDGTVTKVTAPQSGYDRTPCYQYPKAFASVPCDGKDYFVFVYDVANGTGYNKYQYTDHLIIFDENWKLVHYEKLDKIKKVFSIFPCDGSIGILEAYDNDYPVTDGHEKKMYRVFKFNPKVNAMYDMSIPHLVIDE